MSVHGLVTTVVLFVGILSLIGFANILDYSFRTMAEGKAKRAEAARLRKWGLPAPKRPEEPRRDEHLWHF